MEFESIIEKGFGIDVHKEMIMVNVQGKGIKKETREFGTFTEDIEKWMSLVTQVRWNFPGLETQEKLNEHRATVLKFMDKRQAICIKDENEIAGVMLFSRGHNMICYLAVSPEYRRRGVASILMDEVLTN